MFFSTAVFCNPTWTSRYECIHQKENWKNSLILKHCRVSVCWACIFYFYSRIPHLGAATQFSAVSLWTAPLGQFYVNCPAQGHLEACCWERCGKHFYCQQFAQLVWAFFWQACFSNLWLKRLQWNHVKRTHKSMMGYENVLKIKALTAKRSDMTKPWCKLITSSLSFPLSQTCTDPKKRLSLLTDKGMESAIKYIHKKFPNIDFRGNIVSMTATYDLCTSFSLSLILLSRQEYTYFWLFYFLFFVIMKWLFRDFNTKRFVCSQFKK